MSARHPSSSVRIAQMSAVSSLAEGYWTATAFLTTFGRNDFDGRAGLVPSAVSLGRFPFWRLIRA